jgi:hypothetical protein
MMRQLLERLEAQTRTGVTLRVLPGGKDPTAQAAAAAAAPKAMAAVVAQAERGHISRLAGVPVGDTLERGPLRLHRYESALRVTDLTNAGKRGKPCPEFALYNLDFPVGVPTAEAVDAALKAIAKAGTYAKAVAIAREAAAAAKATGERVDIEENTLRGVDVEPAAGASGGKVVIKTPTFELEASGTGFSVSDARMDGENIIPPVGGAKKTAIKAFYAWVQAHRAEIAKMDYRALRSALTKAGLEFHQYSTMD